MKKIEELTRKTDLSKTELRNIFMTENDIVDLSNLRRKDREELRKKCVTKT